VLHCHWFLTLKTQREEGEIGENEEEVIYCYYNHII